MRALRLGVLRWAAAAALLSVAVASPAIVAFTRTEIALAERLAHLVRRVPPRTTVLKRRAGVQRDAPGACAGVVAELAFTELGPRDVANFFGERSSGAEPAGGKEMGSGPGRRETRLAVAWAERSGFRVRDSAGEWPVQEGADRIPKVAKALLVEHAFLVDGVRRVVVFETFPIESRWEPRCL